MKYLKAMKKGALIMKDFFKLSHKRMLTCYFVMICLLMQLIFLPVKCFAWEQDEHMAINVEAVKKSKDIYSGSPKFKNAPIDWNTKYIGPYTSSSSLFVKGSSIDGVAESYSVIPAANTAQEWIRHGGFSADEPNLYASVRHFYDPRAAAGVYELTDHSTIHGRYDGAISALDWAYTHQDNPFNFKNALIYYKNSMEIPEDGGSPQDIPQANGNFRDMKYTPTSKKVERNYYMGKAFRSVGEAMHMISDMAMPAHVRNDSHPTGDLDPIEAYLQPSMISSAAWYEAVPSVNLNETPSRNFKNLALYTNVNFFSDDTIYDKDRGIMPGNGEPPYDRPKLSDFIRNEKYGYPVLFKKAPFNRLLGDIPMVRESLATKIFGKEIIGAGYSIPYYFASDYADILAPLSIKASYRTLYDFFPTFQLTLKASELSPSNQEEQAGVRRKFRIDSELIHVVSKDPAWKEYSLQIRYSGPADLMKISGSKKVKIAEVIFYQGKMTKIKIPGSDNEFAAIDGPVELFVWDRDKKVVKPAGFPEELDIKDFLIDNDESVYAAVNAGGRNITGNSFVYKEKEIKLEFEKKEYEGITFVPTPFKAIATNAPRNIKYAWDFGDETSSKDTSEPKAEHKYEKEGNYSVTLKMLDARSNSVLASAATVAPINNFYGTWGVNYVISESGGVDYILKLVSKAIVYFISMIFKEDVNPNYDQITIKGTEVSCSMVISPPPDDDPKGMPRVKLTQLKSSKDFVKVSSQPWDGVVTVDGSDVVFKFLGNKDVAGITFKGKLDKAMIRGKFNATVYSGTFAAAKQ